MPAKSQNQVVRIFGPISSVCDSDQLVKPFLPAQGASPRLFTSASKCSKCGTIDGGDSRAAEQLAPDIAPGTRHHQLLTTNEAPKSSGIAFIQTVVSKTDPRLASLEIEISRLRDRLKQLEEEQTLLSRDRAQNQVMPSPRWSTSSPQTLLFRFFPLTSSPTVTLWVPGICTKAF
ncbi:hypothetical protein DFH09DRAFT_1093417 [Mycena vulgaris]|nr:hypothetical protein DFH09DRAFT_1093417 [Mycena vulgaris]